MSGSEADKVKDVLEKFSRRFDDPIAMQARIAELEKLVYVPGLWRCPKCEFQLLQANLSAVDGRVSARDEPGDKCPNCGGPLWRVTERQAGNDLVDRCTQLLEENKLLKAQIETSDAIATTARVVETLRGTHAAMAHQREEE